MIGFNFEYFECYTIKEAIWIYNQLKNEGKKVQYFSGGTELITFAGEGRIQFDAVIAINKIPELGSYEIDQDSLYIGAGRSLNFLSEHKEFPLLSKSCPFVADHTSRNKITIGGNLCGEIPFKNAVLPFFISDAKVYIGTIYGIELRPFLDVYNNGLLIEEGELVIQIVVPTRVFKLPYYTVKIRKIGSFGYPLVGLSIINDDGWIKVAFSAVCKDAFRSFQVEKIINNLGYSLEGRVERAINQLPCSIVSNVQGSSEYRRFVLKQQLVKGIREVGGGYSD